MAKTSRGKQKTITFRPGPGHREKIAQIIEKVKDVTNPSDACRYAIDVAAEYLGIKVFYDQDGKPIKKVEEEEENGAAVP